MEKIILASDLLYDLGLGLDPKSDSLILEVMEKYAESKLNLIDIKLKILCSILSNSNIDTSTGNSEYLINRANHYLKQLVK